MSNHRMQEKVHTGRAIDLAQQERTSEGYYRLATFVEGKDYCDATREAWVWSIGRHRETGEILASTSTIFYQNPQFECLFLR